MGELTLEVCPSGAGDVARTRPSPNDSEKAAPSMTVAIVAALFALLLKAFVAEELRRLPD